MKISEYNEMMAYLLRPRQKFANGGIAEELKEFVEKFKLKNLRIPTQNEIMKGTGRASKTIKSYLTEGQDFAKPLTKLEAAKLGGKKRPASAVLEVSDDLVDQFKNLKFTHISPSIDTTAAGSKKFVVTFSGPIKNDFKNIFVDATEENLRKIANQLEDITTGNLYKNKAKQFKKPEQLRKLRRLKDAMYRKKDPYGVYEQLRKYKSKVFPGSASMDIQIQHGQPKFSTQTLSRMGFIPKEVNISPEVEKVERIRNEKLATITKKLKNPNISIGDKEKLIDEFNDTMKGLRGQLKGTRAQGLVNFELLNIDQDGTVTKLKDTGFDPRRGLVASDEDLSKITKERADELIKLGKQKIDAEAVRLNLIPASELDVPEKTKTREMFKDANTRLGANPFLDPRNILTGLGDVARVLSTPTVAATFAGTSIKENLDKGESLPEALADVEVGTSLLYPELAKRTIGQLAPRGAGILSTIGRVAANPFFGAARAFTPIGAGLTAVGLAKDAYERYQELQAMSPEQREELARERDEFSFGEFGGA